jgi:hypothetical protein
MQQNLGADRPAIARSNHAPVAIQTKPDQISQAL